MIMLSQKGIGAICLGLAATFSFAEKPASQFKCAPLVTREIDESILGWKHVSPNIAVGDVVVVRAGRPTDNVHRPWYVPTWRYGPDAASAVSPDGVKQNPPNIPGPSHLFDPNSNLGALIVRIGEGPALSIRLEAQFTSKWNGPLFARMNDLAAEDRLPKTDNSGIMPVSYQICR